MNDSSFIFKFDGTMTLKIKKQCISHGKHWLGTYEEVLNCYCGRLFVGNFTLEQLSECYFSFRRDLKLDFS